MLIKYLNVNKPCTLGVKSRIFFSFMQCEPYVITVSLFACGCSKC